MAFTYYLPDENGQKVEYGTDSNAVIIIGANGAGKSKLGAWIEQQSMEDVHRIGAQRNLNFKENVPLKSYSQAEEFVFYGTDNKGQQSGKGYRWNWGKEYTTKLIDDFDNVLAALIALKNNDNEKFVNECKAAPTRDERPDPPFTAIDKLIQIWDEIFPQRKLQVSDAKFLASMRDGTGTLYNSNQMSDGERAVLYLAAQVLCVPLNKMLIIDEPELHLHRSIMNSLWVSLEKYRPDCFFIYITHDTQFAAAHGTADRIWIKEYDGTRWKFEKIQDNELPEEMLFDILGSRKNVLFVEGEKNSYDTQLYTVLYPDYYVIACGSCTQMFAQLKEEFIDIIIIVALSEDELEKVQKAIFNDKLDNLLKNMFQKKKESRKYARDFIEKHVESVIKDRERITEKEILEAVEISKNVFVV